MGLTTNRADFTSAHHHTGGYTLENYHRGTHCRGGILFLETPGKHCCEQVGAFVGKSKRTIERWSETAEWHTALDNLGFTGDRGWRRNVQRDVKRDDGDIVDARKNRLYAPSRVTGIGKAHRYRSLTSETVNKAERTIRNWRKRFELGSTYAY